MFGYQNYLLKQKRELALKLTPIIYKEGGAFTQ